MEGTSMTQTEALRLALEALENWLEFDPENFGEVDKKAITAIKAALEAKDEPVAFSKQNYLNGYCVGQADLLAEQAKQEPLAWMVYTQEGQSAFVTDNPAVIHPSQRALPLYTTPPQRTWVGLTDEHKEGLICMTDPNPEPHHLRELIDVVEFQLKEKNTWPT
jgi:hypothetical protein